MRPPFDQSASFQQYQHGPQRVRIGRRPGYEIVLCPGASLSQGSQHDELVRSNTGPHHERIRPPMQREVALP